jgi:hypothetical protein
MDFSLAASHFEHACIECMNLHAYNTLTVSLPPQSWRGLWPVMQLHEKRHMKRAGEAGRVLRTSLNKSNYKDL